jgi:hypothetical protein
MKSCPLIQRRVRECLGILSILALSNSAIYSQKILTDTIHVVFHADTLIKMKDICIGSIVDKRDENPKFVRYNSKNKYLVIPLDQEVYTLRPLADEMLQGLQCNATDQKYSIEIEKFSIEKQKSRFSSSLILVADLPVYKNINDSLHYEGTFFYDYIYTPRIKKESLEQSTENILAKWHTQFKLDLFSLKMDSISRAQQEYSNFITISSIHSLYLNTGIATFVGYNWWGFQGEIFFTRPETSIGNRYLAGIFRYQNTPEYESFAIGKQSDHYMYRRNPNWLFDLDFNFLIGFCKWKQIETYDPTLYQLFDIELSSVQSMVYNPINHKGICFRLGIIESLNYVIERNPKCFAGILFGFGVKL